MMSTTDFGIGIVKNRYALIGIEEDIDPLELLKRKELEREARKKTKLAEKVNKAKEPVTNVKTKSALKDPQSSMASKEELKGKGKDNESTKKHVRIVEDNNKFHPAEDEPEKRDEREIFVRGRGGRRGLPRNVFVRGGGRGGGWRGNQSSVDSRGKREFDRQSGSDKTGIKPVDKRDGSGAHNWGNPRDDFQNLQNQYSSDDGWNLDKIEEESAVDCNTTNNKDEEGTSTNENAEEDEQREFLTLDEWKAMKTPRQKPTYNIRRAGEGEDLSQWKKMYVLEKKKEDENDDDYDYEIGDYPQRVGRQKKIEIDICYKDTRGVGGGRGRGFVRGGAQPSGGLYSPRQITAINNNRTATPAPKVDDEADFPSLA